MRTNRILGAIVIAAAIAGVGGAAIYAAAHSPTMSWNGPRHDGPPRPIGAACAQCVVAKPDGGVYPLMPGTAIDTIGTVGGVVSVLV